MSTTAHMLTYHLTPDEARKIFRALEFVEVLQEGHSSPDSLSETRLLMRLIEAGIPA